MFKLKKIRCYPFGYHMVNGKHEIVPAESELLREIFHCYLSGTSLQQLTKMAEQTGLKFRENAVSWNKNMISRMLDDERYWNGEQFPPIIQKETALKAANLKKSKASPKSKIAFIQKRMTCPQCGAILRRNSKKTPTIYWDCQDCGMRLGPLSNDDLLHIVTEKFLSLCQKPQIVDPEPNSSTSLSLQAARLTNEINQTLDQREVDPNKLLPLILECAAEKYKTCRIRKSDHLTIKIKVLLQEHSGDKRLDRELFEQTVERIILQPASSVQLRLLNQKIV